ncbi:thiamine diphosphokinase [Paenibacillus sp. P26]|nr:thiamine diphosphokinase [Paenibacillus sp. P26]
MSCDPVWKDLTDTEMAMTWAMEQGAQDLVLVGVLGDRLDHSLANVHLLRKALEAGVRRRIVDAQNEVQLMNGQHPLVLHPDHRYTQVSLLPLSLEVTGINLSGFLYPLNEATLTIGQSLGISNVLVGSKV